jgi:hypothetical protein
MHWINAFAGSNVVLDSVMIAASRFGVPLLVLVTELQWWCKREHLHVRHACAAAGLSFLLGLALNQIILLFNSPGASLRRRRDPSDHQPQRRLVVSIRSCDRDLRHRGCLLAPRLAASRARVPGRSVIGVPFAHLCGNALRHRCARRRGHGDYCCCCDSLAFLGGHLGRPYDHGHLIGTPPHCDRQKQRQRTAFQASRLRLGTGLQPGPRRRWCGARGSCEK